MHGFPSLISPIVLLQLAHPSSVCVGVKKRTVSMVDEQELKKEKNHGSSSLSVRRNN